MQNLGSTFRVDLQAWVDAAAQTALDAGFLLEPDAERIRAAAALQRDALTP
jgi:hypothetical protein